MIGKVVTHFLRKQQRKEMTKWIDKSLTQFGSFGENVRLSYRSNFIHPEKINLGSNIHIGEGAWWRADAGISIGSNTIISRNCTIFTANHNNLGETLPYDSSFVYK